ncbi:pentapeptide repeat-containing protein, partial [Enterobacter quasiroggenkampii]|nr:pentapeptide repeat-containing protein [Enterobacter quasiroggenkampii]
ALKRKNTIVGRLNLIGSDLKKVNLKGEDLRGAFLIAADLRGVDLSGADLIGADLRDADIRGANLTNSIFITQAQVNSAKGDSNTKLPISLIRPTYWDK